MHDIVKSMNYNVLHPEIFICRAALKNGLVGIIRFLFLIMKKSSFEPEAPALQGQCSIVHICVPD